MAVYFAKEIVSNKFLVQGKAVDFEVLDGNLGVIRLEENEDNKTLIAELKKSSGRFGIYPISEAEYGEKKSQPPSAQSRRKSALSEKLRVLPTRQPTNPFGRQVGAAAAAEQPSPPVSNIPQDLKPLEPSPFVKANQTQPTVTHVPGAAEAAAEAAAAAASAPPAADGGPAEPALAPKFQPATRRISRKPEGTPAAG